MQGAPGHETVVRQGVMFSYPDRGEQFVQFVVYVSPTCPQGLRAAHAPVAVGRAEHLERLGGPVG